MSKRILTPLLGLTEELKNHGTLNSTQTLTLNYNDGNRHKFTLGGNYTITFAFSNWPPSGQGGELQLILVNAGLGTLYFPAAVKFIMNVTPTFSSAGRDRLVFFTEDGGATIDCSHAGYFT